MECRFCGKELQVEFADLGMQPPSNNYVTFNRGLTAEKTYPLKVCVCTNCKLVQTLDFADRSELFTSDYAYFSSYSTSWINHAKEYVEMIVNRLQLNSKSNVIEIASNDGYLLQFFNKKNIPNIGVEPCKSVAEAARQKGVKTIEEFFGTKLAEKLNKADLVLGNNVLAHVPDVNDFIEGVRICLKNNGICTFEFPDLFCLINNNEFDTIYQEHFSYLSLLFCKQLFNKHDLDIFDVEEIPTHGGSLRIFGCHKGKREILPSVDELLKKEKQLNDISTYKNFYHKIINLKMDFLECLIKIKKEGKHIISYGAAAKGNTLFNYCGIKTDFIDYAVDKNPHKQNTFLPGVRIPVYSPERIKETKPDYVIITPWNLKKEISDELDYIREWGGKFIIAIPSPIIF